MEMEKVWISKYALEMGIIEADGLALGEECNNSFAVNIPNYSLPREDYFIQEGDWHKTKESAIKKAEEMRNEKIKSLKDEIGKLESIKFE